ncbi:MAG: sigma 54-interacting transcriptional regulator [Desulfobacterales bacterium]
MISGICLAVGLLHLTIFFRRRDRKVELFFAVMAIAVGVSFFFETRLYCASHLDQAVSAFKSMLTFQGITWMAFAWFIVLLTGATRRRLAFFMTGAYALAVVVNILSPNTIIYATIDTLQTHYLPWNEKISYVSGSPNPWRILADIAWILLIFMAAESIVRMAKRGLNRRAVIFGAGLFIFLGVGYLHGTLMDLGVLGPPYITNLTFLALILVMSAALVHEVVSASVLSGEVAAGERRWLSFMQNVNLLVAGSDLAGNINYVNPHCCRVLGYSPEELLGKRATDLVPEDERNELKQRLEKAREGQLRPRVSRAMLAKNGRLRQVNWFHVVLRDSDDRITGTLSIGEDVTDLHEAQKALVDEKERMDVILSTLNTGLVLLDSELNVVWINDTLRKLFPEGVPIGEKCYAIAENRTLPCEDCGALKALADGRVHAMERYNKKIDKWVQIVSLPIRDETGRAVQVLEATTDITDRKKTEEARDRYLEELEALKARLEDENIYLKEEIESRHGFKEIIGRSNVILYVLEKVRQVAKTDATVLIQGETGVGKELVSRAIHNTSRRSQNPFININCATLPANLVESELFGHEAGAFTGADRLRKGRFELADGGTIFLDEISELPLDLQSKLLRVLQEGQFERVGGSNPLKVDVRVIAATNRNLSEEVAEGHFRPDLFYRLNVYPITVPPLRTRREDILLLVNHFVPQIADRIGKTVDQISPHVLEKLTNYDWPGNVRELVNILERAVITSHDGVIRLPEEMAEPVKPFVNTRDTQVQPMDLQTIERQHIISVLNSVNWRISGPKGAAKILGLNPSTLRFRMQKLGISKNS